MANIVCNFKKCRKILENEAWITICSHAFCSEHGEQVFGNSSRNMTFCPACNTQLNEKLDAVEADLNPSEDFKSVVLAGLKPDIVMDVAMRAISFWNYQMKEETKYQESVGRYLREKIKSMEDSNSSLVEKLKKDVTTNKKNLETMHEEVEKQKKQNEKWSAMLEEKNRKIQKMQYQMDNLKRSSCQINEIDDGEPERKQNVTNIVMNRYQQSPEFQFEPNKVKKLNFDVHLSDSQDSFIFKPVINIKK